MRENPECPFEYFIILINWNENIKIKIIKIKIIIRPKELITVDELNKINKSLILRHFLIVH